MRKVILAAATLAAFASPLSVSTANAQAAAAAPASPHTFTGNVSVVSDYRFRGISQTYLAPALQGGFDYSHSSGFYLGNWNSSVSGNSFNNGAGLEMDFYGGWKTEFANGIGLDLGGLYYYYPESYYQAGNTANGNKPKYSNFELYLGLSYKWLSAKYSHATTDYFGLNGAAIGNGPFGGVNSNNTPSGNTTGSRTSNSKGSGYLEFNANYEVAPKWTLVGHVGNLRVKNFSGVNYTDWKLGVNYDAGFATLGIAYVGTNARAEYYRVAPLGLAGTSNKDTSKDTVVLSISKTF